MNASRRIAVVVNPTKFTDLADVRDRIAKTCADHGWSEPLFFETTEHDPGVGQSAQAVEAGADIVCPLGGDGTVRAVATTLVGTDVPIGLLPGGTGNLLARNLDLPLERIEDALEVVLTGRNKRIDVGVVRLFPDSASADPMLGDDPETGQDPRREGEEIFLVIAGMGLDAEVMARTDERVKGWIGWPAYVIAGAGRLLMKGFRVQVTAGGRTQVQHARTVLVGNCGTLQGNIAIMPDARLDDGVIDGLILAPRGPLGWGPVVADLASQHRRGHPRVLRMAAKVIRVHTGGEAIETQIDGDPKGSQHGFAARVLPQALLVRVR